MYNNRDNYITTDESHNIVTITVVATAALIGLVFKTLTCFVGGVELFLVGAFGALAFWILGIVHNIHPGSGTGYIFWIFLTIVFVALWVITLFHLVQKRLMPALLLLSISVGILSYIQMMNTYTFDGDDWLPVGLISVGVFYLCYRLSLKIVTTRSWRPHKYYNMNGDDDSWNFMDGGGTLKRLLVRLGVFVGMFLLFIAPILVATKMYRVFL